MSVVTSEIKSPMPTAGRASAAAPMHTKSPHLRGAGARFLPPPPPASVPPARAWLGAALTFSFARPAASAAMTSGERSEGRYAGRCPAMCCRCCRCSWQAATTASTCGMVAASRATYVRIPRSLCSSASTVASIASTSWPYSARVPSAAGRRGKGVVEGALPGDSGACHWRPTHRRHAAAWPRAAPRPAG